MALAIHTIKTLIVTLVCLASSLKVSAALRSGLLLSQGGEFAFVIFALAQQHGLLLPTEVSRPSSHPSHPMGPHPSHRIL